MKGLLPYVMMIVGSLSLFISGISGLHQNDVEKSLRSTCDKWRELSEKQSAVLELQSETIREQSELLEQMAGKQ